MIRRLLSVSIISLAFAGLFASPAFSLDAGPPYTWESNGGPESEEWRVLRDKEGNIVHEYNEHEWNEWEKQVNETGDCMGYSTGCAESQLDNRTPIEGPTKSGSDSAQQAVEDAREEGTDLDAPTAGTLDELGFHAESLPSLDGEVENLVDDGIKNPAEACDAGPEACAGGAFLVGLAIGNGLDQLFSLPDLEEIEIENKEITVAQAEAQADKEGKGFIECTEKSPEYTATHYETYPGSNSYQEGILTETKQYMSPGCYFIPEVQPSGGPYAMQTTNICVGTGEGWGHGCGGHEPSGVYYNPPSTPTPPEGEEGHWTLEEHPLSETVWDCPHGICYGIEGSYPQTDYEQIVTFKTWRFVQDPGSCLTHEYTYADCMKPAGVAAPGEIKPDIEENNVKTGLQPAPVYPKPAHVPTKPPEVVKEKEVKEVTEVKPAREIITKPSTEPAKVKEKEEEEETKPLEIPIPNGDELATDYAIRVEEAGFTDPKPTVYTLGEASANPDEGPEDVGSVSPDPGSRAEPGTKVNIGANPDNTPAPSPEGHVKIGGVTEPGIDFPNFGVLCKGFPFGVPCWLAETMEGWNASPKAPEWGIENFRVDGKNVSGSKFDLAKLEPIMEVVRPAMIVFATIGLVLLFYGFAKGGSPPSGGAGDTIVGESGNTTTWEDEGGNQYRVGGG